MEFIRITKVQGIFFEKGRSQTRVSGTLHLTSHHLLFVPGENEPGQELWLCYSTIHSVDKKSLTPDNLNPLYIACRNFTFIRLFIRREQECNEAYATLQRLMNITSVESLFSFYFTPVVPFTSSVGWKIYDPHREFARQGLGTATDEWRFSDINKDYEFSPTYPKVLVVPAKISDAVLSYAVKFRSKGRLPALSYIHRKNHISITRASQPLSGLSAKRSAQDERLVECIFSAGISPSNNNLIVDARPTVNAMANSVTGAGIESTENYKNCRLSFSGIDNIHVVRDSYNRILDAIEDCRGPLPVDKLERSGWLRHIRNILDATVTIVQSVHLFNSHVLVHCSDGWDRTSQLASLAMLCLDPYYRTFEGFAVLVEKEWVSFGHKFQIRCGHLSRDEKSKGEEIDSALPDFGPSAATALKSQFTSAAKTAANFFRQQASVATGTPQRSPSPSHRDAAETIHSTTPNATLPKDIAPIFTQFLDCVYQIWRQFPTHFEFSDRFLVQLNTHVYSCQFGNFLFNNERERSTYRNANGKPIQECSYSVWDWFGSQDKARFSNPAYIAPADRSATQGAAFGGGLWNVAENDAEVLFPLTKDSNQRELLEFWRTLFLRTDDILDGMEQVDRGTTSALDTLASDADIGGAVKDLHVSAGASTPPVLPVSAPARVISDNGPVAQVSERTLMKDLTTALADFNPWASSEPALSREVEPNQPARKLESETTSRASVSPAVSPQPPKSETPTPQPQNIDSRPDSSVPSPVKAPTPAPLPAPSEPEPPIVRDDNWHPLL